MADSASSASTINQTKADAAAITGCNHRRKSGTGSTSSHSSMSLVEPLSLCEKMAQDKLLTFTGSASEIGTVLMTGIVTVTQAIATVVTQAIATVYSCTPESSECSAAGYLNRERATPDSATESASIASTTATTSVPAPAETTPIETSASAATPSSESTTPGSEAPALSTPAGSETSPAPPAGSETSTAPPGSHTNATSTPTPLSSNRSFVNKCRDAERTQRECEELELSEDPVAIVKHQGCG
ncbi:hypothetical protein LTR56_005388 [Elasticomyces elasticus]|nr:hypothetical protein LTR22_020620 [Elasticomyces elasticus]KAK3651880.1 hypothetical protein LTR56_005388 [Elasticomyces elasticus]KAK4927775.1 hypothetical protein LTR49_005400 [Elasticomyces elasticus]KAK5761446.1 hypothetical protein LTS12_008408 [Elasticomyces elasticus]